MNPNSESKSGRKYSRATERKHSFRVWGYRMTIVFLTDRNRSESDYPKYRLRSTDGAYDKELSVKDDLTQGDQYLELRFEKVVPQKCYTLTRSDNADMSTIVFEDVPFREILANLPSVRDDLEGHRYTELTTAEFPGKLFDDWVDSEGTG